MRSTTAFTILKTTTQPPTTLSLLPYHFLSLDRCNGITSFCSGQPLWVKRPPPLGAQRHNTRASTSRHGHLMITVSPSHCLPPTVPLLPHLLAAHGPDELHEVLVVSLT
eukprot:823662-Pyramimonas_sp.AAC.1